MVEKCVWRLILIVFCVQFYVGVIIAVAENRLISNINCIVYWLMFLCIGARSGAPWRPWYNGGSLCV